MTTTGETPAGLRRPPGRYDEPRALSRPVLLGGAAVLVALLVGFAWWGFTQFSSQRTQFANTGYRVTDAGNVLVSFQVAKGSTPYVDCELVARDRDSAEVGSLTVHLGPDRTGTLDLTYDVATTRRALVGLVLACRPVAGPQPS